MVTIAEKPNGDYVIRVDTTTGNLVFQNLRWPNSDGTANQVLITDGSGNLSWASTPIVPYTFPSTDGVAGDVIATDGAGNLYWTATGGGSGYVSDLQTGSGDFIVHGISTSTNTYLTVETFAGQVSLTANGSPTDVNIAIIPKGDGNLQLVAGGIGVAYMQAAGNTVLCTGNTAPGTPGLQLDTNSNGTDVQVITGDSGYLRVQGTIAGDYGTDLNIIPDGQLVLGGGADVLVTNQLQTQNNIVMYAPYKLITSAGSNNNITIEPDGTGVIMFNKVPTLGANMDVKNYKITTTTTNGNVWLEGNGTGSVKLGPNVYPSSTGLANQFLRTDGAGNLTWASTGSAAATHLEDVSGHKYVDGSGNSTGELWLNVTASSTGSSGNVTLAPGLTGLITTSDLILNANGTGTQIAIRHADGTVYVTTPKSQVKFGDSTTTYGIELKTLLSSDINVDANGGNIVAKSTIKGATGSNLTISPDGNLYLNSGSSKNVIIDGNKMPKTYGTSGQFLQTDGSGNTTWANTTPMLDLYDEYYTSGTKPQATGDNSIAFGLYGLASGTRSVVLSTSATSLVQCQASGVGSVNIAGLASNAAQTGSIILGGSGNSTVEDTSAPITSRAVLIGTTNSTANTGAVIIGGTQSTASNTGDSSVMIGGFSNSATAQSAVVLGGYGNKGAAKYGVSTGLGGNPSTEGSWCHGGKPDGKHNAGTYVLATRTTDANWHDALTGASNNIYVNIPWKQSWWIEYTVTCMNEDLTNADGGAWNGYLHVINNSVVSSPAVHAYVKTLQYRYDANYDIGVSVSAGGDLVFSVKGATGKNIKWTVVLKTTQVDVS